MTLTLLLTLYEVGTETVFGMNDSPRSSAEDIQGPDIRTKVPST